MPVDFAVQQFAGNTQAPASGRVHGNWLSVVSHLDPKYGGLSTVVPQLASLLTAGERFHVEIEAFCLPGERYRPVVAADVPISFWPTSRAKWLLDRSLPAVFRSSVAKADGVHIHGLWTQSTLVASRTARALRKPYIVSAHGMLEPWALRSSRARKQLYAALFERGNLQAAACLHALTKAEAENYRLFGSRQPIAVIPNGVRVPASLNPELFLNAHPSARGRRLILFLGRLHPKKGVELLTRAWASLAAKWPDAVLVLAGPSEDQTRANVERLAAQLGVADRILFPGMLSRQLTWSALAAAECFTLPSYSEGLSVSVLEAMGAGLPVIVTENCNMPEVAQRGAGWQIRADVSELQTALQTCLENSPAANRAIGARGAALVRERYSWAVVGAQMAELYTWVQGGARPQTFPLGTV